MTDTLYVRVDPQLMDRLMEQAERHESSPEEEVVTILRDAFYNEIEGELGFGSKVIALFSGSGIGFEEPVEEIHGGEPRTPDFGRK